MGAGASGLICAFTAAKRGKSVLLLEHNDRPGEKILISGGGRCNFTNLHVEPDNFVSSNPHFCKSALSRFSQYDFISLIENYNIEYYEKELGQLFCTNRAENILKMLLHECELSNVELKTSCFITSVEKKMNFEITTTLGNFSSSSLIVATGGCSISKIGATDFGYKLAEQFGISVITPKPGLVPIKLNEAYLEITSSLSGVSCFAKISGNSISFTGSVLFTHKGLSGPPVLQISNYLQKNTQLILNLLPDIDIKSLVDKNRINNPKILLKTLLGEFLSKRIVDCFFPVFLFNRTINQTTADDVKEIESKFQNIIIDDFDTEGFEKAEVTVGGINTNELSSKTFETKKVKGLYFIGEVVDVTGWLGGYNFQWAWSSGYCCGESV